MEKTDLIFIEGFRFFKPRENAPKTIKGNIVITLEEMIAFATKQGVALDQPLRIDLRKSEAKGTYYATLNTWKPNQEKEIQIDELDKPF